MERLQLAFENLKTQTQQKSAASNAPKTMPQTAFAGVDPLLLSVGVFGTGILAGTLYSEYNDGFYKAQHFGCHDEFVQFRLRKLFVRVEHCSSAVRVRAVVPRVAAAVAADALGKAKG